MTQQAVTDTRQSEKNPLTRQSNANGGYQQSYVWETPYARASVPSAQPVLHPGATILLKLPLDTA